MKKAWVLLILGFLLIGCGKANSNETNNDGSGIVAGKITAALKETSPLVFQYEVNNQTEKEVKFEFSSSQRIDYSVETDKGEQIYLFSSLTMFLAVLGEETIKQGESLSYEIDLHELDLKTGDYLLKVWMTSKDGKAYQITQEFTVK
ncbi:BsuPI-related putative proteinase inhibitor [Niallia oryzisoli]|uniref:Intracellular proteinase inhibitor BsuPI domain-containing protein n=1 Tax=Niallia oryzisoli TaxID=1737571 RepID=A0ABZ2C805_9BACI